MAEEHEAEPAAESEDLPRFEVLLTPGAERAYRRITAKGDRVRVNRVLEVLDTVPYIGHRYDPLYDAARLPFEVLVAYAGRYGIHYVVEEELLQVRVYFIEDQRRDPLTRFSG